MQSVKGREGYLTQAQQTNGRRAETENRELRNEAGGLMKIGAGGNAAKAWQRCENLRPAQDKEAVAAVDGDNKAQDAKQETATWANYVNGDSISRGVT